VPTEEHPVSQFPQYDILPVDDPNDSDEETLLRIGVSRPDYVHAQPDEEVAKLSRLRSKIRQYGCAVFLPRAPVIDICQDKWLTYLSLQKCGVPVPRTAVACDSRWPDSEKLHVRPTHGAGGKDSLQETDLETARRWLYHKARMRYTVAESLPGPTVTWQGIYSNGGLIVSQQRKRLAWTHDTRGSCLVGETYSDAIHNKIALDAVFAVDLHPHGIYGVDMTLDAEGNPRVTEINIGRFFTTIEFFAQAGVNFPDIAARIARGEKVEPIGANPLPNGLRWTRAIDALPVLSKPEDHLWGDPPDYPKITVTVNPKWQVTGLA
jgi:carbamoyl-phosphate synthase large subunit